MSDHFQVQSNIIRYSTKLSPRKSLNLTVSPNQTSRSGKCISDDDVDSQMDRQQLLNLQLKQAKQQNKFLKLKIKELLNKLEGQKPIKNKIVSKGAVQNNKDSIHQSIQFFFGEINNLINSLINLYKLQFTPSQIQSYQQKQPDQEDISNPLRRYIAIKKFSLNRRLQKILLEREQQKYSQLLNIFTDFYRAKEESDNYVKKFVEGLTQKALQLNKLVVQKAHNKSILKTSRIRSHQSLNSDIDSKTQEMQFQPLNFKYIYDKNKFQHHGKNATKNTTKNTISVENQKLFI